ncbi:cyclin-dependent kinase B2-2 [Tanacetum coccineum]
MYQRCKRVAFCRAHSVLHKDLTPHNLLLDKNTLNLKIAGLGLARVFTLPIKKYTHEIPNRLWQLSTPPELSFRKKTKLIRASGFTTVAYSLLLRHFPVQNKPDLLLIHLNHTLADPMDKK